ncbi:MAG: HAMP domain-containing protein [Anaerolineae bacterium]|nr:HAMP domain-containing protein [Anaerolineae bacterium]
MNKLSIRLSLAFALVTWLVIAVIALAMGEAMDRSFRSYVSQRSSEGAGANMAAMLEQYYVDHQGWDGVQAVIAPGTGSDSQQKEGRGRRGQNFVLVDPTGMVIAATDVTRIGTQVDVSAQELMLPIQADGQEIAKLILDTPGIQALGDAEEQFLSNLTTTLLATAVGAGLIAALVGGILAWQFGRPIRQLTAAVRQMAGGDRGEDVAVQGTEEVLELAQAFNHLSRSLVHQETLRQHMAANVAHELRTPVTVLRSRLEAILDDMYPLDKEQIIVAHDQTLHLARLVEDLRQLTLAEAGQIPLERQQIEPGELARRTLDSFMPLALDAEISLKTELAADLPVIKVDVDRIRQVLGNVLANALRHTPTGGTIELRVLRQAKQVRFEISNTGSSLTPEQLEHLFEPFWRADESRNRNGGGSGLGLAIARQLVQLHGGRMWAEQLPDHLSFVFDLPI